MESTKIKCEICCKWFSCPKGLKDHTKEQHLSDKLQCEICQRWLTPRRYKRHMVEAHSEPVNCNVCTNMFLSEDNLKKHMENQHQRQELQCEICLKSVHPRNLKRHMNDIHSRENRPRKKCEVCGSQMRIKRNKSRTKPFQTKTFLNLKFAV